jgi:hypothetical protein
MQSSTTPGSDPNVAGAAGPNGATAQRTSPSRADEARHQSMQRAEEMVDRLGEQVGHYVSTLGHSILRWVARAREEAEDIWAEAQMLRQHQRTSEGQSRNAPR